jgi:hypothetical protein
MNPGASRAALGRWRQPFLAGRQWLNFPVPVAEQGIFSFFRARRVRLLENYYVKTIA